MLRLAKDELRLLSNLESIDSISAGSFCDEVQLHDDKKVGLYISGYGVVLEPLYVAIQRFGDILKVGVRDEKNLLLYGGYSIDKKEFVIPLIYSERDFWKQLSSYRER